MERVPNTPTWAMSATSSRHLIYTAKHLPPSGESFCTDDYNVTAAQDKLTPLTVFTVRGDGSTLRR